MASHTFAGRRYKVRNLAGVPQGTLGQCDHDRRVLMVPVEGDTLSEMDVLLHEGLHSCFPWLAEWAIDAAATSLARFLWRLGWRKNT